MNWENKHVFRHCITNIRKSKIHKLLVHDTTTHTTQTKHTLLLLTLNKLSFKCLTQTQTDYCYLYRDFVLCLAEFIASVNNYQIILLVQRDIVSARWPRKCREHERRPWWYITCLWNKFTLFTSNTASACFLFNFRSAFLFGGAFSFLFRGSFVGIICSFHN